MRVFTFLTLVVIAAAAWGISLGAGVFGGAAVPVGDTAGDDDDATEDVIEGAELASSAILGGRVVLGVLPYLEVEAALAYHVGHHPDNDDWEEVEGMDEPTTTVWPLTAGVNAKLPVGNAAFYGSAGLGYYFATAKVTGDVETIFGTAEYAGEMSIDKPGVYVGGGFMIRVAAFGFHIDPRYHYIFSDDKYDVHTTLRLESYSISDSYEVEKDFNDSFVNVTFGVDYYFL